MLEAISSTTDPTAVDTCPVKFQIKDGKLDANDEEAARTVALVFVFTAEAIEVVAELFQTALAMEVVEALA